MQDCPNNPEASGKVAINFIEVVPTTSLPSSSETEQTIPINIITRARSKAQETEKIHKGETPSESQKSNQNSWKARRMRRAQNKKKNEGPTPQTAKTEKPLTETIKESPKKKSTPKEGESKSDKSLGGSVLAEKHHETLDAMLQAYEARLKPLETLEVETMEILKLKQEGWIFTRRL